MCKYGDIVDVDVFIPASLSHSGRAYRREIVVEYPDGTIKRLYIFNVVRKKAKPLPPRVHDYALGMVEAICNTCDERKDPLQDQLIFGEQMPCGMCGGTEFHYEAKISPTGSNPCRIMIATEAPAEVEMKKGYVLAGKTGIETDNLIRRYLLTDRDDVYCTNLFKWQLDARKTHTLDELLVCGAILQSEIDEVDPDVIIALGGLSAHWFLGNRFDMEALNGMPHKWQGRIVVPAIHTAASFRDNALLQWTIEAFTVAKGVLDGKIDVPESYPAIVTRPMVDVIPTSIIPGSIIAIDTETDEHGNVIMITVAVREGEAGYWFKGDQGLDRLAAYVAMDGITTLLHNALFDQPKLRRLGVKPSRMLDTMQMAFLLQTLPKGLKPLAYRLMRKTMREYSDVVPEGKTILDIPREQAVAYAGDDTESTLGVYNRMLPMMYERMDEVLERDCGIMPMVAGMMERGIKVDVPFLNNIEAQATYENTELLQQIEDMTYPGFNPASTQQRSAVLFDSMGLDTGFRIKETKKGFKTTDAKTLKKIEKKHPVVPLIQKWIETDTLIDKYLAKLPEFVKWDGRIHASLSMTTVGHSGRLAAKKPNILAQPTRTKAGKEIRNGYVAEDGFTFVSHDASQIEMRCAAHLSQDKEMVGVFLRGEDIHLNTAMKAFGITNSTQVDEMKHRYPSKRIGFGVLYDITAVGLAEQLQAEVGPEWTEDRCQEFIDTWYDIYHGVREYKDRLRAFARRNGYVDDMFGRRTYMPGVCSVFEQQREATLREVVNQPIQGTAQGIVKIGMLDLWQDRRLRELFDAKKLFYILQVHDDIFMEIHNSVLREIVPHIRAILERRKHLSVPTPFDGKMGTRWGSMEKIK
jgi:uracil-DNA glycosylase family 4